MTKVKGLLAWAQILGETFSATPWFWVYAPMFRVSLLFGWALIESSCLLKSWVLSSLTSCSSGCCLLVSRGVSYHHQVDVRWRYAPLVYELGASKGTHLFCILHFFWEVWMGIPFIGRRTLGYLSGAQGAPLKVLESSANATTTTWETASDIIWVMMIYCWGVEASMWFWGVPNQNVRIVLDTFLSKYLIGYIEVLSNWSSLSGLLWVISYPPTILFTEWIKDQNSLHVEMMALLLAPNYSDSHLDELE